MTVQPNDLSFAPKFTPKFCKENNVRASFYKGFSNASEYPVDLHSLSCKDGNLLLKLKSIKNLTIPPVSDLSLNFSNEPNYVSDALKLCVISGPDLYIFSISGFNLENKTVSLHVYCIEYFDLSKMQQVDGNVQETANPTSIEKENRKSASAMMKAMLKNKELPFKSKDSLLALFWNRGVETQETYYKGTKVIKEIKLISSRNCAIFRNFGFNTYKQLIDSKGTPLSFIPHTKNSKCTEIVIKFGD